MSGTPGIYTFAIVRTSGTGTRVCTCYQGAFFPDEFRA